MIYMGGISTANALEEGIQSIANIPDLYFLIAGFGCDSSYTSRLIDLAKGIGLQERVRFLGEVRERKWDILDDCQISYCLYKPHSLRMSFNATASNKFMEALASGLPVLCNNLCDFQELTEHFNVGVTCRSVAPEDIAVSLQLLLNNHNNFSRNGIKHHLASLNYETQFEPVLKQLEARVPKMAKDMKRAA
jgi:glycosyltransferase involved in cell wall biosynthesis